MYHYVFSAVAIGAASRVITHSRPIYAALWFVMVVLASAGLFLILDAEFMAFAMIIIYGGAILVTYVFVIMLASQADMSSGPRRQGAPDGVSSAAGLSQSVITEEEDVLVDQSTTYDHVAREPAAAVAVGFLLLALLLSVAFPTTPDHLLEPNPLAASPDDAAILRIYLPHRPDRIIGASDLDNIERIGLELFRNHPLGLELAGVILLVSLVGAVVITRTRVDVAAAESKGRQPAS
jgi:NADH-quinone oxidoreductase subunit J